MSEQEIDLRKARPGCEVTFRCGAKLRIASINYAPGGSDKQRVWFVGFPEDSKDYHPSGRQWFDTVGVNDIVAVSNPFEPEDYAFTAKLLRDYCNDNSKAFQAVCSNNLNIILAALDAQSEDCG